MDTNNNGSNNNGSNNTNDTNNINHINNIDNIEPKIITNTYYNNYASKNNINNKQFSNLEKNMIYSNAGLNNIWEENKTQRFLKKLLILSNIEGNFVRIFGIDKLWIPILIYLKKILLQKIPILNKYIFKEKTSSLTITYTHYTSTYYNQQNNSSDYIIYKSILCYVYDKKPFGCKFTSNPGGNFMFFEQFDEIQINKKIWLVSKNTSTNTSNIYMLELLSYTSNIDEINKFIKYCLSKYKTQIQSESIISSGLKYYKYLGMNNSTHQCMFDEYPFTQTKTFENIFFTSKNTLVHKIQYFCSNEDTYKIIGRPYSMGIMLYGKPGTGKTSCIKAIASLTQRHIVDVSLKKIKTQKELSEIFYGNKINGIDIDLKKRLYVLEEFDCIIDKLKDRKNKISDDNSNPNPNPNLNPNPNHIHNSNHTRFNKIMNGTNDLNNPNQNLKDNDMEGVNLENLLCLLDGTVELSGSMFIATTNYIDLIDRALIRPGRFDCCIEFDNASWEIIIEMINHFSKKNIKKLKKNKKNNDIKSFTNTQNSSSSCHNSSSNKLTESHIEVIKKYSVFNDKYVWSPAKISQICLFYVDSPNYYDDVVRELVAQYNEEIKLL